MELEEIPLGDEICVGAGLKMAIKGPPHKKLSKKQKRQHRITKLKDFWNKVFKVCAPSRRQ